MWKVRISIISPQLGLIHLYHQGEPHVTVIFNGLGGLDGHYSGTRKPDKKILPEKKEKKPQKYKLKNNQISF